MDLLQEMALCEGAEQGRCPCGSSQAGIYAFQGFLGICHTTPNSMIVLNITSVMFYLGFCTTPITAVLTIPNPHVPKGVSDL